MGESPSLCLLSALINLALLINGRRRQGKQAKEQAFKRDRFGSSLPLCRCYYWEHCFRCGAGLPASSFTVTIIAAIISVIITIIVVDIVMIIITIAVFTNYIISIS